MIALGIDVGGTSVKCALLVDGQERGTARSLIDDVSDGESIRASVRTARASCAGEHEPDVVGCCLPGRVAPGGDSVEQSVNLPGLVGLPFERLFGASGRVVVVNDGEAAAVDYEATRPGEGRLLALALGTGVGAAVLDEGVPLHVVGMSPGHFGQIDVSLNDDAPIGPDGGRGTLEAYVGVRALHARFGDSIADALGTLDRRDPIVRALARAIRIGHAIYRPRRVVLLGGVGLALRPVVGVIDEAVRASLTSVAEPGWTLETGSTLFHAARGAARLGERRGGAR